MDTQAARTAFHSMHQALLSNERTREPLNALVVWTELGRGLAGTLERVGANRGLLREVITKYTETKGIGRNSVDLTTWVYQLEPPARLGKVETAQALKHVMTALEDALPELAAQSEASDEGRKTMFLSVVRGWFPLGVEILRAFPKGRGADEPTLLAVLESWCERYLPEASGGPAELGVRVERSPRSTP